ncbi:MULTISPECIES: VOC family protein [unclassified Streptomyces]|uniref:VOC family protein n=1 Tax=unclassified Streptomyces TaxID=2593676 RepID=UPI000DC79920|nr:MULTISPECIES: VOC family protein [unclassified Streptomyces]AWZ07000.1 VOC family protein [Streptomyces sp. ICC4]AWZ14670.1 VOC family protein [Streptomyces sp. ICC1]
MTGDLVSAQRFYGAVLGWTFRRTRLGERFSFAFRDGAPVAGFGALADDPPLPTAWTPYFAVDDADMTAARIRERGATVAVGPLCFGTGRAVLAADPDGVVFGLWQGEILRDWRVGRGTAPAWLELRTRDAFAAAIFYGEVLDWAGSSPQSCVVAYEHDHVVLRHGNDTVARISGGAVDADPDPHVRPRWHVYFRVPDLEAAVEAAGIAGGRIVSPVETSSASRWVTLRDPEGALFTVLAPQG